MPTYPIITLDFEASSLAAKSYPIEIGIAKWDGPGHPILGWSSLIAPPKEWSTNDSWTDHAQSVHKIKPEDLNSGLNPSQAMEIANQICGTGIVLCDGGKHDAFWMSRLVQSSMIRPTFKLGSWITLLNELPATQRLKVLSQLEADKPEHRARKDAERLLEFFAVAIDRKPFKGSLTLPEG